MRVTHAKVSQEQGLKMSRTVFTVMVKYSQLVDKLEEATQEIEILDGSIDCNLEHKERLREFRAEIKDDDNFKELLQQWVQASRVRLWITEKKTNLSAKIDSAQRATFVKNKKEKIKKEKEAKEKAKEAAEKKEEEEKEKKDTAEAEGADKPKEAQKPAEVQIDTTSKPAAASEDKKDSEVKKDEKKDS
jgi:colicin import membrane protein